MTWVWLSIASCLFLGIYDVTKKASLNDNAVLPVLLVCSLSSSILLLPLFVLSVLGCPWVLGTGFYVHELTAGGHGLVFIKAGLVTSSWVLTFFAIKHLPISLASPVRASAPVFTVLGAVFLFSERPSGSQVIGILLIIIAYLMFSWVGRKEGIRFERNRWVWMLIGGTLLGAASGLYDKHLLQGRALAPTTVQFWFSAYNAMLQALIVTFLWWPTRHKTTPFVFRPSIVVTGILLVVADALYFRALAIPSALISVITTIRRSNVLVSFSVGALWFGERHLRWKAAALVGVLAGLLLLLR